jgi:cation diffusion facilitator CzcD-associated flavoprotein CzcO
MTAVDEAPTTDSAEQPLPDQVEVAIVGSGFSGLGMAIRLKQEGVEDFVVLERGDDVGGTWHDNTYPGCACDVPSHLYSFSFALKPDWRRTYSPQPEIFEYLRTCADDFGVRPHIRFEVEVTGAAWEEGAQRWRVETDRGSLSARVLVLAQGPLSEPKFPDLPGLDEFEGAVFHSGRWNHDHDVTGERVASIGTGASAIQFVPELQRRAKQVYVFQRTPPWIFPHTDRPTTSFERRLYRAFPALQKLVRGGIYAGRETFVFGFVKNPRLMRVAEALARWQIRRQVPDPELREKVTPEYTAGCKRILPSNKWYPTLMEPNVELVTEGVEEVRPHSVVTASGQEYEVDTIVLGTGFNVFELPIAHTTRGRDGRRLADAWGEGVHAHLGTTLAGFPNLFMLLGPNTGLGHTSMVYMAESQIAYVLDALRTMRERDAALLEVRPEVKDRFREEIDARMERTVWNTGCGSWYQDHTGRISALWPDWTWRFRQRTARFDPDDYVVEGGNGGGAAVAA